MINKVTLIGHLGQDPEIRRLENGTPVGRFSLATSESYKDANDEWQSLTEWHNIVVWRQQAESAERNLKKGMLVYVEGKINYRKYTDKNGIERMSSDIVANSVRLMGKKEGGSPYQNIPTQEPPMKGSQNNSEPVFEVVAPTSEPPMASDDLPF